MNRPDANQTIGSFAVDREAAEKNTQIRLNLHVYQNQNVVASMSSIGLSYSHGNSDTF